MSVEHSTLTGADLHVPKTAAPSLTLGTSNAAGSGATALDSDATIAAFDTTAPVTQAFGDAAATGSAAVAARRDHKHGMPSDPTGLPLGLTGATAATRYVGGTTSGAPASGTFDVGDFVIAQNGHVWVCTVAGSPGTWTDISGGGGSSPLTTKGDLYGYDTADARIPIGTDGYVLTADSTQTLGIKWAAGGGGSFTSYDSLIAGMSGLVHRWKFEEASGNFADSVGTLTLTASGAFTYGVAGGPVSGASGSVTFGAAANAASSGLGSIPTGANVRTFILIFRSAGTSAKQCLFSYGTNATRQWFTTFLNDGTVAYGQGNFPSLCLDAFGDDLKIGSNVANLKVWHMAAFIYDGANLTAEFIDGRMDARGLGGSLNTGSSGNFSIGLDSTSANQLGAATYDDLAVFNVALAPYQLAQLYAALAGALP